MSELNVVLLYVQCIICHFWMQITPCWNDDSGMRIWLVKVKTEATFAGQVGDGPFYIKNYSGVVHSSIQQ